MIGSILREVKKHTGIPYTPMLMSTGIILGYFADQMGVFGNAVKLFYSMDPHVILYIYIPGLIFEGAYNTDGYIMSKSKWQIILLAGPGVLLTTFALALAFNYILGYSSDVTFGEAVVLGSIVATTDPVAVVALLKELGTSIKFNSILEGESLLNDGTAYVLFLICIDIVDTGVFDVGSAIGKFFRLAFGGPAWGIVVGYICCFWL
jgi:NhaP-type Na+/H+ or K+/H+ antiporter